MDLTQLQYFRCIAEEENLTRAAERLYVAQPNLSVSISRLEAELGVSLFERRRGRIRLTDTGRLFLEHVNQVLGKLDDGIQAVRAFELHPDERVRVAGGLVDLVGDLLKGFLADNPRLSFHQISCRNSEVPHRVLDGDADIGFLFGECSLPGLEYRELDRCERIVQLAANHPLAGRDRLSLADLNDEPLICNMSRDDRALYEELAKGSNFRPNFHFECDDIRVEYSMILSGGVIIAPLLNFMKMDKQGLGGMTYVRLRERVPDCPLGMLRPRNGRLSGACLDFYVLVDYFFQCEREQYKDLSLNGAR